MQAIWAQGGTYEFILEFCFSLKTVGTIKRKNWFSFALELIGKLIQTSCRKVREGYIRGIECRKIIILLRDRRFYVHEHKYKALRVILEMNETETKEIVQRI